MVIDAIGVPEEENSDFDLELVFQKALLEGDSEWKQSTAERLIDTKAKRGDLSKCLPGKGRFNFVHVDFEGQGGIAHIIEDTAKFGKYRALETVAGGPLGNVIVNLKQPLRRDECVRLASLLKSNLA